MKRISFFLAFVLTLCAFGIANAQVTEISLDQATQNGNPITNDTILLGPSPSTINFDLRVTYTGTGDSLNGTTCGFAVLSTGGFTWASTSGDTLPGWAGGFDLLKQVAVFSGDGDGTDTIAFNFSRLFGPGAGGNFDAPAWRVIVELPGGINDGTFDGQELCLDSVPSFGPANLPWLWNETTVADPQVEVFPAWLGPYCFTLYFLPDQPPVISNAPVSISGLHCSTLQFDFDSQDPDGCANPNPTYVLLNGPGSIDPSTGVWSYDPSLGDVGAALSIEVAAECPPGNQGPSSVVNIVAENDAPTVINCPGGTLTAQAGQDRVTDLDAEDSCPGDPQMWSIVNNGGAVGPVSVDANGVVTYTPDELDAGPIAITVEVSDGVDASTCVINYDVIIGAPFALVIEKDEGQTGVGALQGQFTNVDVSLTASAVPLGGFNILVAYDNSALSFASVETDGSVLYGDDPDGCEWEYLDYRVGADGNCSGGCPSGLVRIVGIAELNDGPNHPIADCNKTGVMFSLRFLVSNDRTLECQYVPIRFFWLECGDNTLSSQGGDSLFISSTVHEYNGIDPLAPWGPDIGPAVGFPTYAGHPDECATSDKTEVIRGIDFFNGGVDIVCADEIDDRGDINLDGLAYTIADAVMLTNYFVYGMGALPENTVAAPFARQAAIAASDVNADGLTLTVADLVYLIRVVVGDAVPYPKVDPVAARYDVSRDGLVTVEGEMGAAYIVVDANVQPELLADGMEMVSNFRDGQMHVVVWSREGNSFNGSFVNLGSDEISYIEMATADGAPVTSLVGDLVPDNFALAQNYPNPFNPATTIEFSLPVRSDYSLKIYNVTGQLVKEFAGTENAGTHSIVWDASNTASGIYFYKITAGNYTDTKKMVFLK